MKRNIISEIESKRVRINRYKSIIHDLKEFEERSNKNLVSLSDDSFSSELIPVKICSSFETFFREQIIFLIDRNHTDISKIELLDEIKAFRFDLCFTHQIISKKSSLGEFVSHLVSLKNINNINRIFSCLLNVDFLRSLELLETPFTYDAHLALMNYWKSNCNQIMKDLNSLYQYRNIICHAYDAAVNISKDVLLRYLKNDIIFLEITSFYFDCLIIPVKINSKKLSALMLAKKDFIKSENELNNLVDRICDYSNKVWYDMGYLISNLRDEITLWQKYRKELAKSNCELYYMQGTSCSMYWFNMQIITEEKIKTLEDRYEDLFDEVEKYSKTQTFN
jgi:hypothetical protein